MPVPEELLAQRPDSPEAAPKEAGPRRRAKTHVDLTPFSFINSYSAVDKDSNPLITGDISTVDESGGTRASTDGPRDELLHLDLFDLVQAKKAFEARGNEISLGELTLEQFVTAFSGLVGSSMRQQLGYLFMKIDCDCDGQVTWDELLTFVLSQNRNGSSSELNDKTYVKVDLPECSGHEAHRDAASQTIYIHKVGSYVSAGRDGTLRVWTAKLEHEVTLHVSDDRSLTAVQDMCLLPGTLSKLVVASADRVITLYELQDHAGAPRWSVHGRMLLKDMPICLAAWTHVADEAACLAIGTDVGSVPIFDARKLVSLLRDDRVRAEMVRGAIPVRAVERALILTLPLHKDWVTQLVYEPGLGALVSGSLDSYLYVTQLDWPQDAVPSHTPEGVALVLADPEHCRRMCTVRGI